MDSIIEGYADKALPKTAGLDLARIDKTSVIPKYQISVIIENLGEFDENSFYTVAEDLYKSLIRMCKRVFDSCHEINNYYFSFYAWHVDRE